MDQMAETLLHKTGKAPAGDVDIFYRLFGEPGATPILIVHGLSYFSYDWMPVAARLSDDRQVAAIDMRGFGRSGWSPARDYGLKTNGDDLVAVMDDLGWEKAVLMGHSMGGRICLLASGWHRSRVAGLVCVDFAPDLAPEGRRHVANSIGRQPDVFATVDEALEYHGVDPGAAADAAVRKRFEAFLEPVDGGYRLRRDLYFRDKFRNILDTGKRQPEAHDPWQALRDLTMDFLVIRGSDSNLFAAATMDKVRLANALATIVEVEGSHDLAGDNPDGVASAVSEYLQRIGG